MSDDRYRRTRTRPGVTVPGVERPKRTHSGLTSAGGTRPGARVPRERIEPDNVVARGERWAEDRRRRREVAHLARSFLIKLDSLARLLIVHHAGNDAVRKVLAGIAQDLDQLHDQEGDVAIVMAEGHAFVNGVWVRSSRRAYEAVKLLSEGLDDLEGRGIVLEEQAGLRGVVELARLLRASKRTDSDEDRRNAARDLSGIRLIPITQADEARFSSHESTIKLLYDGLETLSRMELANLDLFLRRRQRALVRTLVQLAEDDPEQLLSITAIRDPTMPQAAHTLMVTIYAVAIGREMDLSRKDMMRLGVAALNHNLGEAQVPVDVFRQKRKLMRHERETIEKHPLLGMKHLLVHYGYGAPSVERAIVAAEHHVHWDGSGGYPFTSGEARHAFSRVVAVCDVFDALCCDRPHRVGYPPDQAVKLMMRQAGRELDPVFCRALVRLVGRYPPGSLVELDSGEWAIVLGPGAGASPMLRPRVLLIADQDGFEHPKPIAVDLGERYPRRRAWLRTIARTRDARRLGVRPARYLLADRVEVPPVRLDHDVVRNRPQGPSRESE
ncbi:MAG: HD domain-containing protein [Deltaproteobacteria bacterium]|nr:HD domain-containing protein [Deltaproteobacteria bacterium]